MTPDNREADAIKTFVDDRLREIARVAPNHLLTLVLRHRDNPKANAVISNDPDFTHVLVEMWPLIDTPPTDLN